MANETLTSAFSDIADAIRAKGVTGTMTPLQMPTKIGDIPTGSGTRYGVSGESIMGPVDANGVLQVPNTPFSFSSSDIKRIPNFGLSYKFKNTSLTTVNLPMLTNVGDSGMLSAFTQCTSLTTVNLPELSSVGGAGFSNAFTECTSLTTVNLSKLTGGG